MNSLKGKKVLIFQQRAWAKRIGLYIARKLYEEGCQLAAITSTQSAHKCIVAQEDAKYEMIICHDEVIGQPEKFLAGDDYSLKEICTELGIDSVWPLASIVRMMTRSYKDKYYYGFKQSVSDEEMEKYIKAVYKCIRLFFDKFNPDVIVSANFAGLYHMMFSLYARQKGIKMIDVTDSKVRGVYCFSHSYNDDLGPFIDRIDELNSGKVDSPNRENAKKYISEFRQSFKNPSYCDYSKQNKKTLWRKFREEITPYANVARWYRDKYIRKVKNELPNVGVWTGWRPPKIILRDHYCQKLYLRFANNYNYYDLKKIKKYIYFPLQVQPEATIDVVSPYFSNQIETARLVAMSMPDDYTLVVKNHPGMADYTPPSYLEKVARTMNIKLIDYRIPSEEVFKHADMIIGPGGTSLAEAAFYNKPAIQLGNLGTTLKFPNIIKHTDMTTLTLKIKELLKKDLNSSDYERKLENYVAAAYDCSVNVDYMAIWQGNLEKLDILWQAYRREIERVLFSS